MKSLVWYFWSSTIYTCLACISARVPKYMYHIQATGTDVVVLGIAVTSKMDVCAMWLPFGQFRCFASLTFSTHIDPEPSCGLLFLQDNVPAIRDWQYCTYGFPCQTLSVLQSSHKCRSGSNTFRLRKVNEIHRQLLLKEINNWKIFYRQGGTASTCMTCEESRLVPSGDSPIPQP